MDKTYKKITGSTYTPDILSDFVAERMFKYKKETSHLSVLDPACGDGQLLISLINIAKTLKMKISVTGFDTDPLAIKNARKKLKGHNVEVNLETCDFLEKSFDNSELFSKSHCDNRNIQLYDLIISNPPYVRTQNLGSEKTKFLAKRFNLKGRIDLYQVFVRIIPSYLKNNGVFGLILSNRFMTIKSGEVTRSTLLNNFNIKEIYDLGDTKIFSESVLPAVLIGKANNTKRSNQISFISTYEVKNTKIDHPVFENVIHALRENKTGIIKTPSAKIKIKKGYLKDTSYNIDIWKLETEKDKIWNETVLKNTFCNFADVGKIRVGVKTTADKVFIRDDWDQIYPSPEKEVLRQLITHKQIMRWKVDNSGIKKKILYTHFTENEEKKAINLDHYVETRKYLKSWKSSLEKRKYLTNSGRGWYEIWVPQDPTAWSEKKIIFNDISEKGNFALHEEDAVINGDCYWIVPNKSKIDLIWLLLGVGNSDFICEYYDLNFNNKLFSSKRRFISQYVEKFPIPDPQKKSSVKIVEIVKVLFNSIDKMSKKEISIYETKINHLVKKSFGLIK